MKKVVLFFILCGVHFFSSTHVMAKMTKQESFLLKDAFLRHCTDSLCPSAIPDPEGHEDFFKNFKVSCNFQQQRCLVSYDLHQYGERREKRIFCSLSGFSSFDDLYREGDFTWGFIDSVYEHCFNYASFLSPTH